MPVIPDLGKQGQEDCEFEAKPGYTYNLILKNSQTQAGEMAQLLKFLPWKVRT